MKLTATNDQTQLPKMTSWSKALDQYRVFLDQLDTDMRRLVRKLERLQLKI